MDKVGSLWLVSVEAISEIASLLSHFGFTMKICMNSPSRAGKLSYSSLTTWLKFSGREFSPRVTVALLQDVISPNNTQTVESICKNSHGCHWIARLLYRLR